MSEKTKNCGANTEVFSRVSGFFRPVQCWNKGKKSEYEERTPYKRCEFKITECMGSE